MTDKPIKKCPKCKALKAKRLIGSGSGIIFKGTGFYETDYKRKENNAKTKRTKIPSTKKEDKSDVKQTQKNTAEPKPEKKSE